MKIVHIGIDSQFTAFLANVFESVAPGANEYVIIGTSTADRLLNPLPGGTVKVVPNSWRGVRTIRAREWDCDLIVAHAMTPHAAMAFTRSARTTTTVWSGWGYDYYGAHGVGNRSLYGPDTQALVDGLEGARTNASVSPLRRVVGAAWDRYIRQLIRRAAARADYFSAPVPTDEAILRARYPRFRGRYSQLNYASDEETFTPERTQTSAVRGILLGNSASPFNNHLEAFELLAGLDLGGRRLVVPLSYGEARYRDLIVDRGRHLFGDAFVPLVDHLSLNEYNQLVAGCDIVIMNHRRQQAIGNIGTALHAGARLYLDVANPTYDFLKQSGGIVYPTAELRSSNPLPDALDAESVAVNRALLRSFWGAERVRENVVDLLARVTQP